MAYGQAKMWTIRMLMLTKKPRVLSTIHLFELCEQTALWVLALFLFLLSTLPVAVVKSAKC